MKRKKHKQPMPLTGDIFSPEEMKLAQDALKRFEGWLHRHPGEMEGQKKKFAEETIILLEGKLERLHTMRSILAILDYNEHILLLAAIQQYIFDLSNGPPTPRLTEQLKQCEHIKTFVMRGFKLTQANPTQD